MKGLQYYKAAVFIYCAVIQSEITTLRLDWSDEGSQFHSVLAGLFYHVS